MTVIEHGQNTYVAEFAARGFAVVPDLVPVAELRSLGGHVDRAVADRTRHDTRMLEEKSRYEQSFQQCLNLWEDHPEVRPLTFHPAVAATAARLLKVPSVRVWHDQAHYKEAGGRGTDPHQDLPYWPIEESEQVTAWIPLQDISEGNGAVGYVPGSHRFGVRKFADIFGADGFDLADGPEARGVDAEFADVAFGSVAFHHGLTIHTARPNHSESTRRVYTVIFFADGAHRGAKPSWHPSVDRAGIAEGDVIASDVTPVAWPRPPGDYPERPSAQPPQMPGWPIADDPGAG
jgi:ectoine hydroxylase-related dioxygenase (phytanoyl-CoA dioxygenase family)